VEGRQRAGHSLALQRAAADHDVDLLGISQSSEEKNKRAYGERELSQYSPLLIHFHYWDAEPPTGVASG
jgi:hypothetical protein